MKRMMTAWVLALLLSLAGGANAQGPTNPKPNSAAVGQTETEKKKAAKDKTTAEEVGATEVHELDVVEVEDTRPESGTANIGREELKSMPSRTGSITEALKGKANIQFSNDVNSSLTGGEIAPPRISIYGAKPYENNFMIDGISVTNDFDPGNNGTNDGSFNEMNVTGHDQTIFYNTDLIDKISIYTSNIPAKHGQFLGGVVDAELRRPAFDKWKYTIEGGHTRSKWAHLRNVDENSDTPENQPRYSIYDGHASAEGPINDRLAVLMAVSRKYSTIPLKRKLNDGSFKDDDQYRVNDNYLLKFAYNPSEKVELDLDFTYAPYESKSWRAAWPGSDKEIYNDSIRISGRGKRSFIDGDLTGKFVFSRNGYSRDSQTNALSKNTVTNTQSGGIGDAIFDTKAFDFTVDWDSHDYLSGDWKYNFSTGVKMSHKMTNSWNEAASTHIYVRTGGGTTIETRSRYEEISQSHSLTTLAYYLQGEFNWNRFTVTPGLRVDHDDFSHNIDIAPRLKMEFDTFNDGALRLLAGINRYYGGSLRGYAFQRQRPYILNQWRNGVHTTVDKVGTQKSYEMQGLDTPYSDEYTGGILGVFAGFGYSLEYTRRYHKDQLISRASDGDNYKMTNDGKSEYEGLTLTISKDVDTESFGNHSFSIGVTESKTKTFNGAYDTNVDDSKKSFGYDYDYDQVYYNGSLIDRSDLPAANYNAPLVVAFTWMASFFEDSLRLNSVTRWRDSAKGLGRANALSGDTPYGTTSGSAVKPSSKWLTPDGEYADAYAEGTIAGGSVTDLSVEWDVLKEKDYTFTTILNVGNLFNGTMDSDLVQNEARGVTGRSFYGGFRAEF